MSQYLISQIKRPLPTLNNEKDVCEFFFNNSKEGIYSCCVKTSENKNVGDIKDVIFSISCLIDKPLTLLDLKIYTDFITAGRVNVVKPSGICLVSEYSLAKMFFGDVKICARKRKIIRDSVNTLRSVMLFDVSKKYIENGNISTPTLNEVTISETKKHEPLLNVEEVDIVQANGKKVKGWSFKECQKFFFYDLSKQLNCLKTLNQNLMPPNFEVKEQVLISYLQILQDFTNPKNKEIKFSNRYIPDGLSSQMRNKWKNRIISIFEHWKNLGVCDFKVISKTKFGRKERVGIEITKRNLNKLYN